MNSLSVSEVSELLAELGCGFACLTFERSNVDGEELALMQLPEFMSLLRGARDSKVRKAFHRVRKCLVRVSGLSQYAGESGFGGGECGMSKYERFEFEICVREDKLVLSQSGRMPRSVLRFRANAPQSQLTEKLGGEFTET